MSRRRLLAAALLSLLLLSLAVVFRPELAGAARHALAWIDGLGAWAPWAYVAFTLGSILLFLPAAPLYMAAGILFGLIEGTAYAFVAGSLAGAAAFLIARYLARDWVERKLSDRDALEAVDRAVRRGGLRSALLIRCSPILPSSLLNYGLGASALRLRHHLLSSVAALPGTFLYVYYGKALGDLAALVRGDRPDHGAGYYALLIAGAAATLLATRQITVRARRILDASDAEG